MIEGETNDAHIWRRTVEAKTYRDGDFESHRGAGRKGLSQRNAFDLLLRTEVDDQLTAD